jgi:hypothetical protein
VGGSHALKLTDEVSFQVWFHILCEDVTQALYYELKKEAKKLKNQKKHFSPTNVSRQNNLV